ncbi:MAG: putative porin [Bacteroidota bacterium]
MHVIRINDGKATIGYLNRMLPLLLVSTLVVFANALTAQVIDPADLQRYDPDDPEASVRGNRRAGPQQQREAFRDTFGIFAFQVSNPNEEVPFSDSLLNGWQKYEPARSLAFDYGTVGIFGGAAYPLRYQPIHRRGLDLGYHQFDLYQITGATMSYYRQQSPYTQLEFIQGSEQRDLSITTKFSRNFANGVNFVLDYRRISQLGNRDQYPTQNLRNTNLATGFWINHGGGKYDAFISFAANTYQQQQNGGIVELPDTEGQFATPLSATAFLSDGLLRESHREWMLTQYFQFGGRSDSTGRVGRAFTLSHQLRLNNTANRTTIPTATADTSYFRRFPQFFADERGQRSRIEHATIENSFRLSTFRGGRSNTKARVQKDVLEVGLTHLYERVQQEPRDSVANNLLLTARAGFRPSDNFRFVADGQLTLLGQTGDYRVSAVGEINLKKAGKLEVSFLNQLYTPSILQQQFWLTGRQIYQNDFAKTIENRIEGAITLPVVDIRLGAAYNLLTNYIYYDTEGLPQQTSTIQNILQLTAERDLTFGPIHLDNRLLLQSANQDFIRLPSLVGEHSLYYDGRWFKVLNVNLGFDFRYFNGFRPYYFNPIHQQFQLQDEDSNDFYLEADAFFSMRVTSFRFFIKYIQLNQIWNDQLLNLTADYPYPDSATRIGISWRLVN